MTFLDTVAKIKEKSLSDDVNNSIFKAKNSKISEKYSNYANMLLYGKDNSKIINKLGEKPKDTTKLTPDNSPQSSKNMQSINGAEKIINSLDKNTAAIVAKFKIISDILDDNTQLLRKIEVNTKKQGALLDIFKKLKEKKPTTITKANSKFTEVTNKSRSKLNTPLLERAKSGANKMKTYAKSAGQKTMSKMATGAKSLGGRALTAMGRDVVAGGVGRVAMAGAAAAAAGAVGYGVGSLISKALPDSVNQAIGKGVATVASAMGSSTASDAITTQEKSSSGASLSPVKTEKIGSVSMPKDNNVKQAIEKASKLFDIPKEELYSIAQSESGFNPQAINTKKGADAVGLFQFMPGTWNGLLKQNQKIAEQYGIGKASGKNLDDRSDPYKAAIMYGLYRKGNIAELDKKGLSTGNKTVDSYLAHFLGAAGAKKVLTALSAGKGNEPIVNYVNDKQYKANPEIMNGEDGKPRSINDFLKVISNKSAGKAEAYKKTFEKNPGITNGDSATPTAKGAIAGAATPSAKGATSAATPSAKGATSAATPTAKGAIAGAATPSAKGATSAATPSAKGATSAATPTAMNVENIKSGDSSDKQILPKISSVGSVSPDSKDNLVDTVAVPPEPNINGEDNSKVQPKGNFVALGDIESVPTKEKVLNNALSNKESSTSTAPSNNNNVGIKQANNTQKPVLSTNKPQTNNLPMASNAKATGDNIPMSIRDVPNTIQRILDKEYMRGV